MTDFSNIRLVLSDIDGTLVTPQKEVTPAARQAIDDLRARGLRFAIASSRPVRGLKKVGDAVAIDTPVSGFNGGRIVTPEGELLDNLRFPGDTAVEVVKILQQMGLSIWVFAGDDWYITDADGPRVERETHSIAYEPIIVSDFEPDMLVGTNKIVGVSMDLPLVERAEILLNERFGQHLSATRSQPFYLDITPFKANKGEVVKILAAYYGFHAENVLTIGDSDNDVMMFRTSGYSFAMGNAADAVKAEADAVTAPNTEDGFAKAMRVVLAGI
jgi:Cof subfamily protein (haloacid dehalogenase superfamily)